jgi:sugar phosphate isomerase/epimerase
LAHRDPQESRVAADSVRLGEPPERWPIGVFASVDEGLGVQLDVVGALGVPTIHLHAPSRSLRSAAEAGRLRQRLGKLQASVTCVFAGFEGESYSDIPAVARTVGLVPHTTRDARTAELYEIATFAQTLNVRAVGLHIGFIPHDSRDADFVDLVRLTVEVCDKLARQGQSLHLETGQEPPEALLRFLRAADRPNLHVNFDPANMILYGVAEPIPALALLGEYVRSVHCKDADWSATPGLSWGVERPLGQGAVDFSAMLRTLDAIGYDGPLTIEREISHEPEKQKLQIVAAIKTLNELKRSTRDSRKDRP